MPHDSLKNKFLEICNLEYILQKFKNIKENPVTWACFVLASVGGSIYIAN